MAEDLEDLYQNAPCGYISLGPDGRIVKSNHTFSVWTRHDQQVLRGKKLRDLLNIAGAIFYETHFAPLLRMQGFFNEVALDLITADGERLAVLANAVERRDDAGGVLFTRLTIILATERRRYERDLVEATREARQDLKDERAASELREQFVAVLGHDLRNPLAGIEAGLRLLERRGNEATSGIVSQMRRSVGRMHELINNVLDLTRSRLGGGIALHVDSDAPLEPALTQVIDELRVAFPDRSLLAYMSVTDTVECDQNRIGQLLSNLLGNAVTHGKVDQPIHVRATTQDGIFLLSVENAGNPIPPDTMERLFQPFYRGEGRSNSDGLGLGLYIASQIAAAHGGTLAVSSDTRRTVFEFSMPVGRASIEQSPIRAN